MCIFDGNFVSWGKLGKFRGGGMDILWNYTMSVLCQERMILSCLCLMAIQNT